MKNVTHYGTLIAIIYTLYRIWNYKDYSDPKDNNFFDYGVSFGRLRYHIYHQISLVQRSVTSKFSWNK